MATTEENEGRAEAIVRALYGFGCIAPSVDRGELVTTVWEALDHLDGNP